MKALQRRAARPARGGNLVDMNLVSLIDVFTILIFFLLAHSLDVQTLVAPSGVRLPEARSEQAPREGIELAVSGRTVLLQGQVVATLGDGNLAGLTTALQAQVTRAVATRASAGPAQNPAAPAPPLVLLADRELPYHWLSALLRAAAEAGLGEVSFAVRVQEGA